MLNIAEKTELTNKINGIKSAPAVSHSSNL